MCLPINKNVYIGIKMVSICLILESPVAQRTLIAPINGVYFYFTLPMLFPLSYLDCKVLKGNALGYCIFNAKASWVGSFLFLFCIKYICVNHRYISPKTDTTKVFYSFFLYLKINTVIKYHLNLMLNIIKEPFISL